MDIEKLIEDLRGLLKQYGEKIPYGELAGAPWPYSRAGDLVWQDPEPYFIEQAATALSTLQAKNEKLRAELELKHNQQATTTEVINVCALNELRAYKEIGSLDYFKRLAEMDKAGKYIQPAHLAAIRDMSRILAVIGPALQDVPEEIENVLRLYDSEIKEARED